jgi:hypothetical protein
MAETTPETRYDLVVGLINPTKLNFVRVIEPSIAHNHIRSESIDSDGIYTIYTITYIANLS